MESHLEREFHTRLIQIAPGLPEPEREYRFHNVRKWRFDFSWPDYMVAVEIEGGTHVRGRHNRGRGFTEDCYKYNAAALQGWTVLRFTADMLRDDPAACIAQVVQAIGERDRHDRTTRK